jgi:ArsR family transcriptional regulator, virulence genes transcriptional regulator
MNIVELNRSAEKASDFLKSLANPNRLRILCLIMEGERPVGELADAVGINQSATSQHLALMRREGLVKSRRAGQTIYYQLADKNVARTLKLLSDLFCPPSR